MLILLYPMSAYLFRQVKSCDAFCVSVQRRYWRSGKLEERNCRLDVTSPVFLQVQCKLSAAGACCTLAQRSMSNGTVGIIRSEESSLLFSHAGCPPTSLQGARRLLCSLVRGSSIQGAAIVDFREESVVYRGGQSVQRSPYPPRVDHPFQHRYSRDRLP
jgi:hypothetical protein